MIGVNPGWQRNRLKCPGIDPPGEHLAGSSVSELNSPRESDLAIWHLEEPTVGPVSTQELRDQAHPWTNPVHTYPLGQSFPT